MDTPHDHARPDLADQWAAVRIARAMLTGDDPAAHDAASAGTCPACTTLAATSFGIMLASRAYGDTALVSEPSLRAMLAAVDAAETELRAAGN